MRRPPSVRVSLFAAGSFEMSRVGAGPDAAAAGSPKAGASPPAPMDAAIPAAAIAVVRARRRRADRGERDGVMCRAPQSPPGGVAERRRSWAVVNGCDGTDHAKA